MNEKTHKSLSDMSLEELWQLFPIVLTAPDPRWREFYEEERKILRSLLPFDMKLYHVGSTAINGIWAKPIVDIIIVTCEDVLPMQIADVLQKHGYIVMSADDSRISLNKGYTIGGFAGRVFHIHIRRDGDIDEVYFRDYLNAHSDIAKEYERLKLKLWKKYEHNRDAYTDAKTEFVNKYTLLAKQRL